MTKRILLHATSYRQVMGLLEVWVRLNEARIKLGVQMGGGAKYGYQRPNLVSKSVKVEYASYDDNLHVFQKCRME